MENTQCSPIYVNREGISFSQPWKRMVKRISEICTRPRKSLFQMILNDENARPVPWDEVETHTVDLDPIKQFTQKMLHDII